VGLHEPAEAAIRSTHENAAVRTRARTSCATFATTWAAGPGAVAPAVRAKWGLFRLRAHGLFSDISDAISFRSVTDKRVSEHAPFQVYGLWLVA
jgi:hypothetical protein